MCQDAPAPPPDIRTLTGRMAEGEETAWRQFHELYFPRLLRYLLVVSGGRDDVARDALQATFLRVVRHIRRFEQEDALWSWLTVLARSALVDDERKRSRYRSLLDRFFLREHALPASHDPAADARLLALLEHHLTVLPAEDRALLEQKYLNGSPVRAIAHAAGATEKSVESRLVRIRRHLRESILSQLNHEDTH